MENTAAWYIKAEHTAAIAPSSGSGRYSSLAPLAASTPCCGGCAGGAEAVVILFSRRRGTDGRSCSVFAHAHVPPSTLSLCVASPTK